MIVIVEATLESVISSSSSQVDCSSTVHCVIAHNKNIYFSVVVLGNTFSGFTFILTKSNCLSSDKNIVTNFHPAVPLVRPRFTDAKIKSFMIVRAGNSARFTINFEVIQDLNKITYIHDNVYILIIFFLL